MASVRHIADFFIRLADATAGDVMTHLRLQKLVYYAQAWSLAIRDKPLFPDVFQAWPHGPVSPALWSKFKTYGFNPIPVSAATTDEAGIPADEKNFLAEVWRAYGDFTAKKLEDITHSEEPWIAARGNLPPAAKSDAEIKPAAMKRFYKSKLGKKG